MRRSRRSGRRESRPRWGRRPAGAGPPSWRCGAGGLRAEAQRWLARVAGGSGRDGRSVPAVAHSSSGSRGPPDRTISRIRDASAEMSLQRFVELAAHRLGILFIAGRGQVDAHVLRRPTRARFGEQRRHQHVAGALTLLRPAISSATSDSRRQARTQSHGASDATSRRPLGLRRAGSRSADRLSRGSLSAAA